MQKKKSNKILIIYSDFYPDITENLLKGSQVFLDEKKVSYHKIRVDGSLEIPFIFSKEKQNYSGFIILGCVIKGETDHYEIVKNICLKELYSIAYKECVPIGTSLLTVNSIEQAIERSDTKKKNYGKQAAKACYSLMQLINN